MMNPFITVFASGFFLFNSAASPRKVAGKFEGALRKEFPTAKVDVEIKGKRGLDVINGKFRDVRITMSDFELSPNVGAEIKDNDQADSSASNETTSRSNSTVLRCVFHIAYWRCAW